jgi:general secretion pathway protein D
MTFIPRFLLYCLTAACLSLQAQPTEPPTAAGQPRILRGTDQVIAPPSNKGVIVGTPSGFKFEEAPLGEVVGLILREIAKVDYVIHPPMNGTVTMATQSDVSPDQAIFLLEAALQANGLQMARDARGTYHIGRPDTIKGIVPAIRQAGGGPLPPGFGAIIVPLKFIGAPEMAAILRPMAPPDAILRVDSVRNLLVLAGTRTQAEGWLDVVATFDVDLLKGMSVGVFPLKYVTAGEIEAAMRLMSSGGAATASVPTGGAGGAAAAAAAASRAAEASATAFPLFGALRILPMDRINSVIVVTSRAAYLDEARRWIDKLDKPGGNSAEAQLFVYPVQNGNAKHLASVLNGLFGDTPPSAQQSTSSGVAPGLQQSTGTSSGYSASGVGATFNNTAAAGRNPLSPTNNQQASSPTTLTLKSGLRVMADEINNAVLVYGTRAEYEKIETTLKRLDVPPVQVLIEASIIEVTLNDDLKYGLQWMFEDPARNGATGTGVLSRAGGSLFGGTGGLNTAASVFGATPAGFSYTLRNTLGDVRAVLNALAEKSLVKVISSPSLMVLDNHTANIAVGNQQPIRVGETVTSGGNITTNIQYKDTGVTLSVTPSVNSGNMVTMQLNQGVTDVGLVDDATGQRSFLQRQFGSKVAVRSGETLVLGGLIRDNTAAGKSGLPGLQDIPLIGALFGTNTKSTNRTELLVVITPRVVRTEQDVRQLGQELKDRMKTLYPPLNPTPRDDNPEKMASPPDR